MARKSLFSVFFIMMFCVAHAESNRPAVAGIPYRLLWHAYSLSKLSAESGGCLIIKSKIGVNPEQFSFGPLDEFGNPPVRCNSSGVSFVRWVPEFHAQNRIIFVDQPKGSLELSFKWHVQPYVYPSFMFNLLINGRTWVETTYHFLVLKDEFPNL